MAVTTKKTFNAVGASGQSSATVFTPVGIQLNNQDDLDVYVTLSGGSRVLQLRQATGSTATSAHPQVNNTDGLYFPAVSVGTTLYNYQLSTDNNTITFNSALPQGAVVFCERRTRDESGTYTTFASGSTIRATDLNNSATESNFTAQDGRNKALTIEGVLFRGDQPSTNFITTDHIVAGTIVNGDIADNSVTSSKIVDGTIVADDLANDSVITSKILNDAVVTAKIADSNVTTPKIADLNVTRGKLEADAVDGSKLADNAVNTEHYTDNSIQHVHLQNDIIDGDNIQDNVVDNEHIAPNAVRVNEIKDGEITSAKLNPATVITSSEQSSATTNDTSFLTSAAADARFFNISSGDTIKDGDTFPDNDTTIATTAAINDRIIDLVEEVGGFVPIANETSFPTANPDINNGTGTLVSIQSISSTRTPSSGTVTIANGAGSGNTVSITGCGSTVLSAGFGVIVETTGTLHTYTFHRLVPKATEVTTVAGISTDVTTVATNDSNVTIVAGIDSDVTTVAGIASNVTAVANNQTNINAVKNNETNINAVKNNETNINTVAGSNSAVNSVANSITSVNTAASNLTAINKFGDTYQVAASNPSTDGGGNAVAEGDLYFNTSANRLKVYDGANWVDGVIASGGGAQTTGDTFTGDLKLNDNVKLLVGTGSDLEIFHHASNGSFINDAGTSTLKLQTGGSTKLEIVSTGIDVAGNITISGTVDGRDVAADGTSLDNIEAGNLTTNVNNGNIKLTPNGTGAVVVRGAAGYDGTLQLNCSQNSHGVKIKSPPHSAGASYTLTLPNTDGNNNQVLKTDGSGNLDWSDVGTVFLVDGSVTSTKIANDTIVNADINSNAAIDVSKLSGVMPSGGGAFTGDVSTRTLTPASGITNADLGGGSLKYRNLHLSGNISVDGTVDGRDVAADGTKLDGIESGATADLTATEILNLIKTVDGSGSGLDASALDGLDSTQFVRSDASDTLTGGTYTIGSASSDEKIILTGSSNPYIRFQEGTSNKAYIQWNSGGYIELRNQEDNASLIIRDDIKFSTDGFSTTSYKVWHEGNDGPGSGLNADTVDGIQGSSLLRSDTADTTSGLLTASAGLRPGNLSVGETAHANTIQQVSGGTLHLQYNVTGNIHANEGGGYMQTRAIRPESDSSYNIGTASVRYANGYFDTLYGDGSNLTGVNPTIADGCIYENNQTISSTVSTSSSKNSFAAGDITITGTLTVANNTTFVIL